MSSKIDETSLSTHLELLPRQALVLEGDVADVEGKARGLGTTSSIKVGQCETLGPLSASLGVEDVENGSKSEEHA